MKTTYKITFPFKGQVKTQLVISRNRLIKPNDVKAFENAVRGVLADAVPLEERPLVKGHILFEMRHFTMAKRAKNGMLESVKQGDLDNLMKALADCFQPLHGSEPALDKNGEAQYTRTGKLKTKKVLASEGVIENDKYIAKAVLEWIPVKAESEERIEVYLTSMSEEELLFPPSRGKIVELN